MMNTKISLVHISAVTTYFLVVGITNVGGKKMVVFSKPFFSSNVHKSKAFKNIEAVEATETITSTEDSTAESKTTTSVTRTFTCTSQKTDNTTKRKPTPITLHQTPITTTATKASTSYSLDNLAAVSTENKIFRKSTEPSTLHSEVSTKSVTTFPMEVPTKALSTRGTQITSFPAGFTSHLIDATTAGPGGVDNSDSPTTADKATSTGAACKPEFNKKFNNSCYKFVDFGATMSAARSACKADSSHLVFIETKEENDFLVKEAGSNTEYWIGIHERPNLFWDNGNQVTFVNIDYDDWRTFNDRTGCYLMSKYSGRYWMDIDCSTQRRYICECEGTGCLFEQGIHLNTSSYKVVDFKVTRPEARSACERDSSHLVFIETEEENNFLVGKTKYWNEYWIGIHGLPNLLWDDGNQVTFTNVDPDNWRTFNDGTGCYRMTANEGRYWRDKDCSVQYGYICEYECN